MRNGFFICDYACVEDFAGISDNVSKTAQTGTIIQFSMLPGAVPPTEELILGDEEGNGILDEMQQGEGELSGEFWRQKGLRISWTGQVQSFV